MNLSEIRIRVNNWQEYDLSSEEHNTWSLRWQYALDVQTDIHRFLDAALEGIGNKDWAGKYAVFLSTSGINHQTDNGWWSEAAVSHENLTKFVSQWK